MRKSQLITCTVLFCAFFQGFQAAACNITTINLSNIVCNDNGTPTNATDDYMVFTINPAGTSLGAGYDATATFTFLTNITNLPITLLNGSPATNIPYGSPVQLRTAAGSISSLLLPFTVLVTDLSTAGCTQSGTGNFPPVCSVPCNLTTIALGNVACNNNGTPGVTTDDYMTFSINPAGANLGTGYAVTLGFFQGGIPGSFPLTQLNSAPATGLLYGSTKELRTASGSGIFPGPVVTFTVTVTDNLNTACIQTGSGTFPTDCLQFKSEIIDRDNNTKVQTESLPNEDKIRFKLAGTEVMVMSRTIGGSALFEIPGNNNNIFLGTAAGSAITTGNKNVFVGTGAGGACNTGVSSTFIGFEAGLFNVFGTNTFVGAGSGRNSTSGTGNTFLGVQAGLNNTTGNDNTLIGGLAGQAIGAGKENVAVGKQLFGSGFNSSNCTFLGFAAKTSAVNFSNSTALGNGATVNASNKIRFGNTAVSVIEGQAAYTTSDGRFKSRVQQDAPGLDFIMGLNPVTYRFDYSRFSKFLGEESVDQAVLHEKEQQREMGFIAQDIATLCQKQGIDISNIVHTPESETDNYSVAYGQLVVPLVKAVQEQQAQIAAQQVEIETLKDMVQQLMATRTSEGPAMDGSGWRVWPNPTGTAVQVELDAVTAGATIQVQSAGGKTLMTQAAHAGSQKIDLKSIPAGTYFIQVNVPGKTSVVKSLIKY